MVGIKLVLTMGVLKVFFFEKMKIKKWSIAAIIQIVHGHFL